MQICPILKVIPWCMQLVSETGRHAAWRNNIPALYVSEQNRRMDLSPPRKHLQWNLYFSIGIYSSAHLGSMTCSRYLLPRMNSWFQSGVNIFYMYWTLAIGSDPRSYVTRLHVQDRERSISFALSLKLRVWSATPLIFFVSSSMHGYVLTYAHFFHDRNFHASVPYFAGQLNI